MKHFFRFLCVMAMLCYSMSGFGETANLWVGESWTFEPVPLLTIRYDSGVPVGYNNLYLTWSYDQTYFSLSLTDNDDNEDTEKNNVATVTLKHIFPGEKMITCTYYYYYQGNKIYNTITYVVVCNKVGITVYPTSILMDINDSQTLQWQFSPAQSNPAPQASFTSSNPSVATVDLYGKVTAVSAGSATITASTNYWTSATCQVTVNPMLATSISLNQSAMNLTVGSSQKLTATVLPAGTSDKSVTWTSSDESIATVDANGNVTGITTGLATITVTTNDGSNLSASCAVTVSGITANAIRLDKTELEMSAGQSYKLTATVLPAGAQQRVTWSSSDPSVARVVGGTVYAQAMGECLITARTLDGTNLTADCLIMVYPEGEVPTPTGLTGDMNGDGKISIADVTALIDYLLSGNSSNNSGSNEGALDGLIW